MAENNHSETFLREILETQQKQLALTEDLLRLEREHLDLAKTQYARAEAINDRAEAIQTRQASLLLMVRRATFVVLPIIALLIVFIVIILSRLNLL